MTSKECDFRDKRIVNNIQSVLRVHDQLREHAAEMEVSIENSMIVVRGKLPSSLLKDQVIPAVRQAGVLRQVCDFVRVAS